MSKLANISGRDAVKAFLKFGYTHVHTSGDHAILQKHGSPTLSISYKSSQVASSLGRPAQPDPNFRNHQSQFSACFR